MSDESGGSDAKSTSDILTDQFIQNIGRQIQDILAAAGFTPPAHHRSIAPADLGRLICAFASIEDPRVRNECLSLIEAINGSRSR
jgi:hypothetical protein